MGLGQSDLVEIKKSMWLEYVIYTNILRLTRGEFLLNA